MVPPLAATCPHCNKPLLPIGPLYLGKLFDDEILGQMQELLPDMTLGTKKELLKILTLCREELPTSSFYDYHMLAQKLATSPPAIDAVIGRLRAAGYAASRTHLLRHRGKNRRPAPRPPCSDRVTARHDLKKTGLIKQTGHLPRVTGIPVFSTAAGTGFFTTSRNELGGTEISNRTPFWASPFSVIVNPVIARISRIKKDRTRGSFPCCAGRAWGGRTPGCPCRYPRTRSSGNRPRGHMTVSPR